MVTRRDSDMMHRPFLGLNRLIQSHQNQCRNTPPSAQPRRSSTSTENNEKADRRLFLEAMADVTPLPRSRRCRASPPTSSQVRRTYDDMAEGHRHLSRLVATGQGFQIALTPEYMEGIGQWVPPDLTHRLHNGAFSIQDHLDLHGLTAPEAKTRLFSFLEGCIREGKRMVLVIHGRGLTSPNNPVLKEKVAKWLFSNRWRKWVMAFTSARGVDGGAGATYVLLRHTPLPKRACRCTVITHRAK